MYKIKERNQKPLNFQVCVIQSLNHGNWNGKGIYQARGTINSSFQDMEQLENRRWLDLERELDWKEQKKQKMYKIHEKNFTVSFQSQKNKNSA